MLIVGVKFLCAWREQFVFYMDVGSRWWIVGLWPKSIWKFILLFFCFVLCLYKARMPCILQKNKLPLVYCNHNKNFLFFPPMDVALLKVNHVNLFVCSFSHLFLFHLAAILYVYDISGLLHLLLLFLFVLHHFHNRYKGRGMYG